ncbi:hypothetical protein QYM36_009780 [Artemia franciscana]|uniref:Insulin-like domain-containing protein n=2 Tax=Artemia franciscana TaxID=6661 RepID=A0AA88HVG1_ARTSF|nr:hypothetical protein QYM36_009780 [Artemia franciscana]KAK2714892.1 hypothetical protein QYM36_009780 [Artemia franciscana]
MYATVIVVTLLATYATSGLTYEIDTDREIMAELASRDNDIMAYHRPISPRFRVPMEKRSMRLCGRYLVDALKMICKGSYAGPGKRSVRSTDSEEPSFANFFSNINNEEANTSMSTRVRRGIVDDCCKRYCTYSELSSYCYGK